MLEINSGVWMVLLHRVNVGGKRRNGRPVDATRQERLKYLFVMKEVGEAKRSLWMNWYYLECFT